MPRPQQPGGVPRLVPGWGKDDNDNDDNDDNDNDYDNDDSPRPHSIQKLSQIIFLK